MTGKLTPELMDEVARRAKRERSVGDLTPWQKRLLAQATLQRYEELAAVSKLTPTELRRMRTLRRALEMDDAGEQQRQARMQRLRRRLKR